MNSTMPCWLWKRHRSAALWDAVEVSVSGFCLTPGPYTTYGGMLKQPDKQEATKAARNYPSAPIAAIATCSSCSEVTPLTPTAPITASSATTGTPP